MPGAQDVRDKLDALVREFGFDENIYSLLPHNRGHRMSAWNTYEARNLEEDNLLLFRKLDWILLTCRKWKLANGRKDVLEALAKACALGMKTDQDD
jgi:hypothetical protein